MQIPLHLLYLHVFPLVTFQTVTVQEGEEEQRSTLTTEVVDVPPKKKKFMFICKISSLFESQPILIFNSCSQYIPQVLSVWSGPTD